MSSSFCERVVRKVSGKGLTIGSALTAVLAKHQTTATGERVLSGSVPLSW